MVIVFLFIDIGFGQRYSTILTFFSATLGQVIVPENQDSQA